MQIENVRKKWFGKIEYYRNVYEPTDVPVIGGIAEAIQTDAWSTAGKFYLIDDYIYGDGDSTSIIGDDNEPCGVHPDFSSSNLRFYKLARK